MSDEELTSAADPFALPLLLLLESGPAVKGPLLLLLGTVLVGDTTPPPPMAGVPPRLLSPLRPPKGPPPPACGVEVEPRSNLGYRTAVGLTG